MNDKKKYIVFALILFCGITLASRLFYLQVVDKRYKLAADDNITRENTLYPYRGTIFDRDGRILVSNEPIFDLKVVLSDVHLETSEDTLRPVSYTHLTLPTTSRV